MPNEREAIDIAHGSGLRCGIEGRDLVIRISARNLAFACERNPENNPYNEATGDFEQMYRINHQRRFAEDVVRVLDEEGEDGSTLVTRMLDKACMDAIDSGSEAITEVKHARAAIAARESEG